MSLGSDRLKGLAEVIERWGEREGLSVSILGSHVAGGIVVSASLLPSHGYATLYERYASSFGLDKDACGKSLTTPTGEVFEVLGLDPVGAEKKVVVLLDGVRKHLSIKEYKSFLSQTSA